MPDIELLEPNNYRHIPWKNGGGMLVHIAGGDGGSWSPGAAAWHYGRTVISKPGPFSDLAGFERLQIVIKGQGLVLETPDGEIDLRHAFRPQRYDGATPIVTRLESGTVEVANLIADRNRFRIDLRVGAAGEQVMCARGVHIIHAAAEAVLLRVRGSDCFLADDHAACLRGGAPFSLSIVKGRALIASVYDKTS